MPIDPPAGTAVYRILGRLLFPAFRSKTTVEGADNLPRQGGYVIAANHVDWLDGFYIAAAVTAARGIPVHFLTASNNYWWTTVTVQIPAQRGEIVDRAVAELKRGKVVCNFIEGQRNGEPALRPGKTGAVRMAAAAGVPIVPLGISCPAGRTMAESVRNLRSKRHSVRIAIGRPITVDLRPDQADDHAAVRAQTETVMRAIAPLAGKR